MIEISFFVINICVANIQWKVASLLTIGLIALDRLSWSWNYCNDILAKFASTSNRLLLTAFILTSANEFNRIFINKVKRLRTKSNHTVPCDASVYLRRWLNKRSRPIPELTFRKITEEELDKSIKRLKGNKSRGIDQIYSFILKLAAPHIEYCSTSSTWASPNPFLNTGNYSLSDRTSRRVSSLMVRPTDRCQTSRKWAKWRSLQYFISYSNTS